jgi:YidC/Oxa1 family membrane protein insertase
MGNLIDLLLSAEVLFPKGEGILPFVGEFVNILIRAFHGGGVISYGVAIIFFTIIFKLMLAPLDFANKYFTKKNQKAMEKMKPELDAVKERHPGDMVKMNQAQQEVYRKHGYKMTGFCLFTIVNLVVVMLVFFSVFTQLRAIADYNVMLTVQSVQAVHQLYQDEGVLSNDGKLEIDGHVYDGLTFTEAVNEAYASHSISFLWIRNIWKGDSPLVSARMTEGEYVAYFEITDEHRAANPEKSDATIKSEMNAEIRAQFVRIDRSLNAPYKRHWNGLFLLVGLAGATSWASIYLSTKLMASKKKEEKPKEPKAVYSMRDAKNLNDPKVPQIDPQQMQRIMMIALPAMMVLFTLSSTAALAIYIITNSVISTLITLGTNWPVDKLLAWQESRKTDKGPEVIDPNVINPHAKYFKRRKK